MRIAWSLFAPVLFSFKPFTTAKAAIVSLKMHSYILRFKYHLLIRLKP